MLSIVNERLRPAMPARGDLVTPQTRATPSSSRCCPTTTACGCSRSCRARTKGSTALYERIGDLKAFDLIRRHFGSLRGVINRNHGAFVKTIGDAVMASFIDPIDALRAGPRRPSRPAGSAR
jgi:hypothetical protein